MPRIDLPSGPEAPSLGLRALEGWLAGVDEAVADRVRLAAGELLGNAVAHGPGRPIGLEWTRGRGGGVLRIVDGGEVTPDAIAAAQLPEASATCGRGLFILHTVADAIAVDRDGALRLDFRT